MLYRQIIFILLLIPCLALAVPAHDNQRNIIYKLFNQKTTKLKRCAKNGYLAYQNVLSAIYLAGRYDLYTNKVKAFAWAEVALIQIKKAHKQQLITKQVKYVRYVAKKLSDNEVRKGKYLAQTYIKIYGKSWANPPLFSLKNARPSCKLSK